MPAKLPQPATDQLRTMFETAVSQIEEITPLSFRNRPIMGNNEASQRLHGLCVQFACIVQAAHPGLTIPQYVKMTEAVYNQVIKEKFFPKTK